jgi:hypothetical protein
MNRAAPRCTWLRVRVGHFISASANAFIYYVIDESGGGGGRTRGAEGRGSKCLPRRRTRPFVIAGERASASERRGSSTLSSYSGALGRFTVTSGSRTKALISVPGRQAGRQAGT